MGFVRRKPALAQQLGCRSFCCACSEARHVHNPVRTTVSSGAKGHRHRKKRFVFLQQSVTSSEILLLVCKHRTLRVTKTLPAMLSVQGLCFSHLDASPGSIKRGFLFFFSFNFSSIRGLSSLAFCKQKTFQFHLMWDLVYHAVHQAWPVVCLTYLIGKLPAVRTKAEATTLF